MKDKLKNYLNKFPAVSNPLRRSYKFARRIYPTLLYPPVQEQIKNILKDSDDVFFVQIGSNDGVHGDPINDLILKNVEWRGIFVEPVKFLFDRLKQNYRNSERFIFENVAIGSEKGSKKFYYISEKADAELDGQLGPLYDQLGSFNKQHILKHIQHVDIEPYIVEADIKCLPLTDVLIRNNVRKIDLLHIDTEGFDYQVLAQVDFTRYQPKIILYEHAHLSREEKIKAKSLLRAAGYRLTVREMDTLATLDNKKISAGNGRRL